MGICIIKNFGQELGF